MPASAVVDTLKEMRVRKSFHMMRKTGSSAIIVLDPETDRLQSIYNFTLDKYTTGEPLNAGGHDETMRLSDIRPFGKWYEHYIGAGTKVRTDAVQGVFGVSRYHILQRGLDFYGQLLAQVSTHPNPEVGHYLERSWGSIFSPPDWCFYHVDRETLEDIPCTQMNLVLTHRSKGKGMSKENEI